MNLIPTGGILHLTPVGGPPCRDTVSEPPINPALVTDHDGMDHQEVVYDREDRPVVPDPERVERGVVRPFSFLRCFFGSVSPASDASSSPICTAAGLGMLLEVVTGRRGDDHAVGHSSFSSAMTSSRV